MERLRSEFEVTWVFKSKEGKQSLSQLYVSCGFCVFVVEHQIFIEVILRAGVCVLDCEPDCNALSQVEEIFELSGLKGKIKSGEDINQLLF